MVPLAIRGACPACGATARAGGRFCPDCGSEVTFGEAVLRRLHAAVDAPRFAPFLPQVTADGQLVAHAALKPGEELYTLAEVRALCVDGLHERHVAWIWRRLLSVLGFVHSQDVVHAAVFPPNVLIEPLEHKLILAGWHAAVADASRSVRPIQYVPEAYRPWLRAESASRVPPTPALDIALAARSMIDLLGGDGATASMPATVDPALQRHLQRCLHSQQHVHAPGAWQLLNDFDRLIDTLWGPRRFQRLVLPPRRDLH